MYDQDSLKAVHALYYNAKAIRCVTQTVHTQRPFYTHAIYILFFFQRLISRLSPLPQLTRAHTFLLRGSLFTRKHATTNAILLYTTWPKAVQYGAVTYDTEANWHMRSDNAKLAYSKTLFSEDPIYCFLYPFFRYFPDMSILISPICQFLICLFFSPDTSLPSMSITFSPMCPDPVRSNACYVVPRKHYFPDVYSTPLGFPIPRANFCVF